MKVEVTVPEEYMGDVIGDVNSRRGRLEGMEARLMVTKLSEVLFHYQKCLDMQQTYVQKHKVEEHIQWNHAHYEEVPKSVLDRIVASKS